MTETSSAPDVSALEIPIDTWTQPFWDAAAQGRLELPRCADCKRFRWPPGPFCPDCQSQRTEWIAAGGARLYSFTILRGRPDSEPAPILVPGLVEFPEADGVRLPAAIVDTPLSALHIGADLNLGWSQAANARVPIFSVVGG